MLHLPLPPSERLFFIFKYTIEHLHVHYRPSSFNPACSSSLRQTLFTITCALFSHSFLFLFLFLFPFYFLIDSFFLTAPLFSLASILFYILFYIILFYLPPCPINGGAMSQHMLSVRVPARHVPVMFPSCLFPLTTTPRVSLFQKNTPQVSPEYDMGFVISSLGTRVHTPVVGVACTSTLCHLS